MQNKKNNHKLTGIALFLIGVFAIIFSHIFLPVGSSSAQTSVTTTFLPGQTVNTILKSLATGASVINDGTKDTLIQQILRTGGLAQGFATGVLSTSTSETPIIAWFDNGILYYYSDADILYLNQDSSSMFYKIQSGTYIDTSGWDTTNVINMYAMFAGCKNLTGLDVSSRDTSNVTTMQSMFQDCNSLTELDVSNWDTSKVTNMMQMFHSCSSLTGLDVSEWNTSKVTNMFFMFSDCSSLTELDVSNWDTSNVTNMHAMFQNCQSLTSLDVSSWNTSNVTNMSFMFSKCSNLTELDVSSWNTSNVTDMNNMFGYCKKLTELDVTHFDTSKVTNMSNMFSTCSNLTGLDVTHFDTSKVTNMSKMFSTCSSLTELDVTHFDTSKVTNMSWMFSDCSNLTELDVTHFDTSSVTNMSSMFYGCSSLTELDVTHFDTSKVTNMSNMFSFCSSLTELDVTHFDTSKVTNMGGMFQSCYNLETIYASTGFVTSGVTSSTNMFNYSNKLVGGHGTKFNSSIVDKPLAVLDSESQSGYLTYDIAVSFKNTSEVELTKQVINVGDKATQPTNIPGAAGYYSDKQLSTSFDFNQNLRKYTEVYVKLAYTATFMVNGATSIGASTLSGTSVTAPSITKNGWEILGWSTNPNATTAQYSVGATIPLSADTTFYAITKKTYTVTFQANGATSIGANSASCNIYNTQTSCDPGSTGIKPSDPSRTGSIFSGWYLSGSDTEFDFENNTITSNITLYAHWDCEDGYTENLSGTACIIPTAIFETNGADTIGSDSMTGLYVTAPSITRDGWTIIGWSTDSGATEAEYEIGDTISLDDDVIYYAITKKTYTATFQSNGATSIGANILTCDVYNTDTTCRGRVGTITICNPNNSGECLTMQDRNLGAGVAGTGESSYGNYYQWGNNYGFSGTGAIASTTDKAIWDDRFNNSGYYGEVFIKINANGTFDYWNDGRLHNNLWGGGNDAGSNGYGYPMTNPTDRRGPCPMGYHVPSAGEWSKTVEWRVAEYTGAGNTVTLNTDNGLSVFGYDAVASTAYRNYFLISLAGYRLHDSDIYFGNRGIYANLWSSSTNYVSAIVLASSTSASNVSALGENVRSDACPIRCFKDRPLTQPNKWQTNTISAPSIIRDGWETLGWSAGSGATEAEYQIDETIALSGDTTFYAITKKNVSIIFDSMGGAEVNAWTGTSYSTMTMTGIEPSDPNRSNSIFFGWYLSGSDVEFDFENTEITGNVTLYAHWDCEEGYTENLSGDACVKLFTVTLNPNGGSVDTGSVIIWSGDIFDLSGYMASSGGYAFVGWGESADATSPLIVNPTVTGDITFYAVYKLDTNNNGIADEDEMFTVVFDSNGGVEIPSQYILSGESIIIPIPTKTGSEFQGWFYSGVGMSDYYIIDVNDSTYPQGCNTSGLDSPAEKCILEIPANSNSFSGYLYVAPASTEVAKNASGAYYYCKNDLNIFGLSWNLPMNEGTDLGTSWGALWSAMRARRSKIYNLTASAVGQQKSNHYWGAYNNSTTNHPNDSINCIINGGDCGRASSSIAMSSRCIMATGTLINISQFGGEQYLSGDAVYQDVILVAKRSCITGYIQSGDACLRDIVIISFNSMGGTNVSNQELYYGSTGIKPSNPTKSNSVFYGWYLSGSETEFDFENTEITGNITLYAHWDCEEGYIENLSGDACVKLFTVTLNPNGGSVDTGSVMIGSGDIFDLSGYTANSGGYAFVGWGESVNAIEPLAVNPTIIGDITLYAVYKVDTNNNGIADEDERYIISFDSQGGSAIVSQGNISLYATGIKPSDPSKDRSIFSGWYLSGSNIEFDFENTQITGNIVLYAHWDCDTLLGYELVGDRCVSPLDANTILDENPNFEFGAITIPRPDSLSGTYKNSPSEYIIMDRNLGAIEAGTGVSAYGYYYQYGNNYGFVGEPIVTGFRATANIDLTPYGPSNPYYSGTFITEEYGGDDDWAVTGNVSIWGKESIKESLRQGPCPVGWHIPTKTEWSEVVDYWIAGSGGGTMNVSAFRDDLKIPLPGVIARSTAKFEDNSVGLIGRYRVTSLNGTKGYAFEVKKTSYNKDHANNLVNGYSLRCFKDDDTVYVVTYSDGVMGEELFADYTFTGLKGDFIPAFPGGDPSGGTGRIFDGWYMDVNGVPTLVANPSLVQITGDISLYAKWLEYVDEGQINDLDIYLALDSGHQDHYTIMNRNMGADVPGTGSASYGYHYQWGNNYGFSSTGDVVASSTKEDASGYGPGNYFSGSTFITGSKNWSSKRNDDLWGDTSDTSLARQGPCPVGYHVPSAAEWLMIHNSWSGVNVGNPEGCMKLTGCVVKIQNDLLLPNVGRRAENGALGFQSAASYWTSTPSDNEKAYGFYYNKTEKTESLALQPNNQDPYARGRSVRCVKNTYNEPLSLQLNGGTKAAVSVWSGKLHYLTNPTKSGYEFAGWYKDAAKTVKIEDGAFVSTNVTTLYAKWSGEEVGYTANHYLKKAGLTGYDLYDTEVFSGDTMILLSDIAKDDLNPCAEYSSGSLIGDENGPGEIAISAIGSPGVTTTINLYYIRKKFTVDLTSDLFTNILAGTGEFECGQEVEIRAYPIEGYHFDVWEGEVD